MNNIKVNIKGKNINNYIKWLIKENLEIVKLDKVNDKEINVIINYKNYNTLKKYSKTYQINIIRKYGKLKIISIIKNNITIIFSIIFAIFFLYFLSNIIFSVEIISNDNEMIKRIDNILKDYNLKKYKIKKSYKELESIKKSILNYNKDILEWIEIEESGTKYIIKYVERKTVEDKSMYDYQSITASKDAVLVEVRAYTGERLKVPNDYIKKDEVAISGILEKTDGTKLYSQATGYIYGEVWYKVNIEYPYTYYEEKVTGNYKYVPTIKLLNYEIPFFPYKKYKKFTTTEKILFRDLLGIFKITLDKEYEAKVIEDIYTEDEVIQKSILKARQKLLEKNNKIIDIKNQIILDKINRNNTINMTIFFSAIEDITKIVEVKKEEITDN